MRVLLFHVKEISFKDTSNCDGDVYNNSLVDTCSYNEFNDAICIFVAVEREDDNGDIRTIGKDVRKYAKNILDMGYPIKNVIVAPFVHLTYFSETPEIAKEKIIILTEFLTKSFQEIKIPVARLGFGSHKSIIAKWITFDHSFDGSLRRSNIKNDSQLIKLWRAIDNINCKIDIILGKLDKLDK